MIIAIPSKGRSKTIETIKRFDCQNNKVYLFVEPQDHDSYLDEHFNTATIVNIKENDKGIVYVRNFILDYFKNEECVLMLDDDISKLQKRNGYTDSGYNKLTDIDRQGAQEMVDYLEKNFKENKVTQLTISFAPSNWLKKDIEWVSPSRVWCFSMINPKKLNENFISYDPDVSLFEDYDITAQIISKGLLVVCNFNYTFVPKDGGCGGMEGGCQFFRSTEASQSSVENLIGKWGTEVVIPKYIKEKNIMEVQFLWKKINKKV